jgi:hypothetical protein
VGHCRAWLMQHNPTKCSTTPQMANVGRFLRGAWWF